jgi:hypothetical protein
METAAIAVKAKENSHPPGGLESRIKNSEFRIETACR